MENSGGSRFAIHREVHRDHLHKHGRCCYDKFERAPAIEWNIKFLVEQRAPGSDRGCDLFCCVTDAW